jgi:2'-5' RNA ligase
MGKRCFIGTDISDEIKNNLEELYSDISKIEGRIRLIPLKNLHITYKFLGNTDENLIEKISLEIEGLLSEIKKFNIEVKGVGLFKNIRNPRIIWIGLIDEEKNLSNLSRELNSRMSKFGFEPEKREFKPHTTVARIKSIKDTQNLEDVLSEYKEFSFGKFEVKNITLYESILEKTGAIYKILKVFNLQ